MPKSKKKPVMFHSGHSFIVDGKVYTFIFQVYTIGIYGALKVDNEVKAQGSYTTKDVVKIEKEILKREKEGKIQNLKFGVEIIVQEDSHGLYERIYPEIINK